MICTTPSQIVAQKHLEDRFTASADDWMLEIGGKGGVVGAEARVSCFVGRWRWLALAYAITYIGCRDGSNWPYDLEPFNVLEAHKESELDKWVT